MMRRFATAQCASPTTRRWASTKKSDITDEKLLDDIQSALGDAGRVDIDSKTVSTASGSLPVPPVMDPAWIRARRRTKKDQPSQATGRFQQRLRMNPFGRLGTLNRGQRLNNPARALASPVRMCSITNAYLPRDFLQDFEIINHPEKPKEYWVAPGAQAVKAVRPQHYAEDPRQFKVKGQTRADDKSQDAHNVGPDTQATDEASRSLRGNAPIRFYVLGRKEMLAPIDERPSRSGMMLGPRSGTAYETAMRGAEWKKGTGDLWAEQMRRTVSETLITRANQKREGQESRFILPVTGWEQIADVQSRESILWLPKEVQTGDDAASALLGSEYATYDIGNAKYNAKMPVFNLHSLLGPAEVARLQSGAPEIFGQHQIVVLKRFPSNSMISLHRLLWRLQGYLRKSPEKPEAEHEPSQHAQNKPQAAPR